MVAVRGWLVGFLALLVMSVAAPVWGHAELESSEPNDGATLTAPPPRIEFTFGERLLAQGNAITLTVAATGERLALGPVDVAGDAVSVAWPDSSPAGEFRAAFRVVSADGHPITGSITFDVAAASGPTQSESQDVPAGSGAPAASPPGSPAATASTSLGPSAGPAPPAQDDMDLPVIAWVLGLGVVVLLGAGASMWYLRRGIR